MSILKDQDSLGGIDHLALFALCITASVPPQRTEVWSISTPKGSDLITSAAPARCACSVRLIWQQRGARRRR